MISICTMGSAAQLLHATGIHNTPTLCSQNHASTSCPATLSSSPYTEPASRASRGGLPQTATVFLSSQSCSGKLRAGNFEQNVKLSLSSRRSEKRSRQSRDAARCAAAAEEEEMQAERPVELPIFPLPLVLFPGAILPLQIFEFRYRIMMHTLLQSDQQRFGVVYTEGGADAAAAVGCVGEVIKHERLIDDRFFMVCKGQERFRVRNMVRTKPYLVAEVEWLEDRPPSPEGPAAGDDDVETLAAEVEAYMKDVIRLSHRVSGKVEQGVPDDLRKQQFPTPFSFWVGSTFEGAPVEQQALLELEDTAVRLQRERDTLRNTINYLTAVVAVKDALPSMD